MIATPPRKLDASEVQRLRRGLRLRDLPASAFDEVRIVADLVYSRPVDRALKLDLYLPADADGSLACVVVIRGGGFRAADKNLFAPAAAYLAAHGFAAACIEYRGIPGDVYPATVHDTKAAVRFVRAHAEHYRIDPQRIGALGQSAGGHLALMLATTGDDERFEGDGGHAGASSRVQATVSWAGVFDMIHRWRTRDAGQGKDVPRRITEWVGEPFDEASERWRQVSPYYHVTADDPPALLVHCTGDTIVPADQSGRMVQALRAHHPASRLLMIEADHHGIMQAPAVNRQAWSATLDFLETHLVDNPSKSWPGSNPGNTRRRRDDLPR